MSLCHADAAVPEQHRNPLDRHARQEQFDGKRISESVGVTVLDMRQVKQLSQAALPINQPHSLVLTRQSRRRSIGNCTRLERDHRCESDQERGRHPDGLAGVFQKLAGIASRTVTRLSMECVSRLSRAWRRSWNRPADRPRSGCAFPHQMV